MTDDGTKALAAAIVKQAAEDYRSARKYLSKHGGADHESAEYLYYVRLLSDTESFFKSKFFYTLGGTEEMFKELKRECSGGIYKRTSWK